jgi:hypothetical protein
MRATGVRCPAPEFDRRVRPVTTSVWPAVVSSTQCAAVRTADGPITLPPQNWPSSADSPRVTTAAM